MEKPKKAGKEAGKQGGVGASKCKEEKKRRSGGGRECFEVIEKGKMNSARALASYQSYHRGMVC